MPPESDRREDQYEFARRYETYLDCAYGGPMGRAHLVESIAKQISERKSLRPKGRFRVFDCAAGSGFPALDLRQDPNLQAIRIRCSDGDADMLAQLVKKAEQAEHLPLSHIVPRLKGRRPANDADQLLLNWANLDLIDAQYEYVMCRGNSIAYADTWSGGDRTADSETLSGLLHKICERVKPGGWLHIDAPWELHLGDRVYEEARLDGEPCTVWEEVEAVGNARLWTVRFKTPSGARTFQRYSSRLTIHELAERLSQEMGFKETTPFHLAGERSSFGVIIAQKPLHS